MINQAPEIISQSKIEETDYNALKITLLGVIGVATSIFAVYEFDQFLLTFQYAFLWFALFGMVAFLVINILLSFFVKHFLITFGIIFAETFVPIVFFTSQFSKPNIEILIIGFILFFVFTLLGVGRGVNRFRNSIKMKFFEITKVITPKLVTGILILASILFYGEYFLWGSVNESMARTVFDQTLRSTESIAHLWYSDISGDQTVNAFFESIITTQLKKTPQVIIDGVPVNMRDGLKELTPEMQKKIMGALSDGLRKKAEEAVGTLNPNAKVSDVLFQYIKDWIATLSSNMKLIFGIGVTVLLFFSVKSLMFLLYWLINLIAFLVFKLLIVANFAVPGYETRTRDFVLLP
ncbi:MAG: hypothetical protein WC842_01695 [Candidatus Paceibacterota bacterium]|jgi:hypothetical protein